MKKIISALMMAVCIGMAMPAQAQLIKFGVKGGVNLAKADLNTSDFKTDNLEEEEMFIQKYNIQLDIYKRALEKLTGISVEKTYIYSFKLGKEIEIKYE